MQSGTGETGVPAAADLPAASREATESAQVALARGSAVVAVAAGRHALALARTDVERAAAALVTGQAMLLAGPEPAARTFLSQETAVATEADPAAAALMLAHAATSATRAGALAEALAMAERAAAIGSVASDRVASDRVASDRVEVLTRSTLASVLVAASQTGRGCDMLPSDDDILRATDPEQDGRLVATTAGLALVWAEDLDRAGQLLTTLATAVRATGAVSVLPSVLVPMALLAHRRCRWHEAEAHATEALDLVGRAEQAALGPATATVLTTVEAALGRAVTCRSRALGLLDSPAGSEPVVRSAALSALGLLELGEGRLEAAAHWFEVLSASVPGADRPNPGVIMWEADLAEAYIGLGRAEQARRTLERLEARSQIARSGRASAAVVRCRAALADDDAAAEALFGQALQLYEGERWRFARARTVMALGERRIRSGREAEAREALQAAGAEFDALGAAGWSRRVVEVLARLVDYSPGAHPAEPLTPTEAQVAMAAALGADIAAIASGLFISESQASAHLRTALDKLGLEEPSGVDMLPLVRRLTAGRSPTVPQVLATPGPAPSAREPLTGVTIRMLGGFAVEIDGRPRPAGDGITAQAVKMVALAGKVPVEELIDRLWPEGELEVGRTRLRSLLARMRRQLGPVLERRGSWVVLADHVTVDVEVFERHAQEAQVAAAAGDERAGWLAEAAADLYSGELLPTDRHLDFTAGPRERLRRRYLAVVELATDHACRQQLLETAVRRIEGAIAADPHDEHLYIKAAAILAGAGRPSEALSMIRRAEAALAELGLGLGPEATGLRARLRSDISPA